MNIKIPYKIGDKVRVDGNVETIRGIHIYVTQNSEVVKWRFHIGGGKFVTVDNIERKDIGGAFMKRNRRRRG